MQATLQPAQRRVGPIVTLLLLAPIIVEFLFGSTHVSMFYLILPQIGVYGCGALIIRDLVRLRGRGWPAILLMGIAFAIVLECLTLQTALAPLFIAADPGHIYGRSLGVNWVYLLYALGYESVWAIVLPIQLTELLFPDRRTDLWLGRWGLIVASAVFLVASAATWYLWGQAIHRFVPGPGYQAPLPAIGLAVLIVALLFVVALGSRAASSARAQRRAPRPWLARLAAFLLALFWFVLVIFSVGVAPSVPAVVPAVVGLLLAALAFGLVRRWSARSDWGDAHRLALITGALLASMLIGFLVSGIFTAEPIDVIGKLALDVLAVVALTYLAWRLRRQPAQSVSTHSQALPMS